jgi:hypothetical protein
MNLAHGTVVAGKVVVDGAPLPDGTNVYILGPRTDGAAQLAADELAEVEAALAEDAAGETMSGEEFLQRLRRPVPR